MRKTFFNILLFSLVSIFLTCGCTELAGRQEITPQLKPGFDPNALVLLVHIDQRKNDTVISWPRVAVAVGDGTIILTAKHCVDTPAQWSRNNMSPDIVAISPYYGDIYKCEIVDVNEKSDLAILKAPWPVHPALALADEEEFLATEELTVFSRPIRKSKKPNELGRLIRTTTLPVNNTEVTKPITGMSLKGTGPIVPGWSGSPIVLPDSAEVAGVTSAISGFRLGLPFIFSILFTIDTIGSDVESIWELLRQNDLEFVAKSYYPSGFEQVKDAQEAFSGIMDYMEMLSNKDRKESLEMIKNLVTLRPESGYVHFLLAASANRYAHEPDSEPQTFFALAESSYSKAIEIDPNNTLFHVAHGDFLINRNRDSESLIETETALALDPNNVLASINKLILLTRTEPNKAENYAKELIDRDPNNPDYWFYYGNALSKLDKNKQALEAAQKAVALNPKGNYNGGLADILVKLGRLEEAERNYKKMTKSCGCQRCWFKYANFLISHRPKKLAQAEKALAKAEEKAHMLRISKENMAILRLSLTAAKFSPLQETSPKKAETLARKLIKKSPENGYNFWALAGALRAQEKYDEAVQAAQQAVSLCPDCPFRPRLADCLIKANNLEEAEQTYDEMLKLHPDRPRYWFWYAKFLIENFQDRTEEAQEALKKMEEATNKSWSVKDEDIQELRDKMDKNKEQ